jgi:hypothetical protein
MQAFFKKICREHRIFYAKSCKISIFSEIRTAHSRNNRRFLQKRKIRFAKTQYCKAKERKLKPRSVK